MKKVVRLWPVAGITLLIAFALYQSGRVDLKGRWDAVVAVEEEADREPANEGGSCTADDGLTLCRCYCRVSINNCESGEASYASLPLSKTPWNADESNSVGYIFTNANTANQCAALSGGNCQGYIRPSTNPEELGNVQVDGRLLGCQLAAY